MQRTIQPLLPKSSSTESLPSPASPRNVRLRICSPGGKDRNRLPFLHTPRRFLPREVTTSIPVLSLTSIRDAISAKLTRRKARTDRSTPHTQQTSPREMPSFELKYSVDKHTFQHQLTGLIHLRASPARLLGAIHRQNKALVNAEIEEAKAGIGARERRLPAIQTSKSNSDRPWKVLAAIKHLVQLRIPLYLIPRLGDLVPKQPYDLPHSYLFLKACRSGNAQLIRSLLRENRWLALSFDHIRQTGLHWLAKRGHADLLQDLVDCGAFIDARDSAGRTALYIAVHKSNLAEVRKLLSLKANPYLRSCSGKRPSDIAKSATIQRLLLKAMLLQVLLKFVPTATRAQVWQREGLQYFQAKTEIICTHF